MIGEEMMRMELARSPLCFRPLTLTQLIHLVSFTLFFFFSFKDGFELKMKIMNLMACHVLPAQSRFVVNWDGRQVWR